MQNAKLKNGISSEIHAQGNPVQRHGRSMKIHIANCKMQNAKCKIEERDLF